jgi:pSer/pThr/pTyr-binding forkhead associated (FHA) protein
MAPFTLLVLKVAFLVLLYFFVYRTVRAVASPLVSPRAQPAAPAATRAAPAATGRSGKAPRTLMVIDEKGSKASHRLDGAMQIGRGESCHIRLSDTYASTMHARIFSREGTWFVEDLGSTNGTYLNQRRVTAPAELRAGDQLRIGKTVLELRR